MSECHLAVAKPVPAGMRPRAGRGSQAPVAGLARLGRRRRPEAKQEFGEVSHAGASQPFAPGGATERLRHSSALDVVAPEVAFEGKGRRVGIAGSRGFAPHHALPVPAFVGLGQQVVVDHLFVAVKTHGRGGLR